MRRRDLMGAGAAGVLVAAAEGVGARAAAPRIDTVLRPYLAKYGLPALAAAVVRDVVVAAGAVGTRRAGADIPVTIEDRFHIGSDTKAMTATTVAMFVEAGRLRWDSRMEEVFPDQAATMDPGFRRVTVEQLLSHTSGLPSDNDAIVKLYLDSFAQDGNVDELRLWLLRRVAPRPLEAPPGTRFAYSNLGYTLAGAIVDRLSGRTWAEEVAARLIDPLGLTTAGFGPQASLGRVDAPLGHLRRPDGTLKPMLTGNNNDVPPMLGPAGEVHLSVLDFATWAGWNAGEGKRGPALVRPETLRKLHTKVVDIPAGPDAGPGRPSHGGYGLGWGVAALPFSPEPFVTHSGSNEMNLAMVFLQPAHDYAMVMMTNVSDESAKTALLALAEELYRRHPPAG